MKTVIVKELSLATFQPYGTFANLVNPASEHFGAPPVEFYRDIIQQDLGGPSTMSYSICRVEARPPIIAGVEYHDRTCEGILSLDNDVYIHVAAASSPRMPFSTEKLEVFRVPRGTFVVLRQGVWHLAPYSANDKPANVLVALPERTYVNDCGVVRLEPDQQVEIVAE